MNAEKIAEQIKKIRKENNLTQKEFADLFGVTYQAVSKWENALNIPDISILTEICNRYHCDIQDFLNGEYKKKNTQKKWLLVGVMGCIIVLLCFYIFFGSKEGFHFKTLSSSCDNFEITGSMAYNKERTSIYISNVSYCGKKDDKIYQSISCSLYEENEKSVSKIEDCKVTLDRETSLDDFLSQVKFQVDDYAKTCKNYSSNTLYLEIEALENEGEIVTYKIPLKLESNCN